MARAKKGEVDAVASLMRRAGAAPNKRAKATATDDGEHFVTTVRLGRDQHAALQRLALERRIARGGGALDVSELIREAVALLLAQG